MVYTLFAQDLSTTSDLPKVDGLHLICRFIIHTLFAEGLWCTTFLPKAYGLHLIFLRFMVYTFACLRFMFLDQVAASQAIAWTCHVVKKHGRQL